MKSMTPAEILALKREIFSALHCAMPGIVESFDAASQTVSVRPALRRKGILLPVIRDVPVFFPGSRDSAVTWPVSAGDECLLVFADFDIDRWFEGGEAEEAASGRGHDLSDAFAFIGFRSRPGALPGVPSRPGFFGLEPADKKDLEALAAACVKAEESAYTTLSLGQGGTAFVPHVTAHTSCAVSASVELGRIRSGAVIVLASETKGVDVVMKNSSTNIAGDRAAFLKHAVAFSVSGHTVTLTNNDTVVVYITVIA